jgi:alpha-amylase
MIGLSANAPGTWTAAGAVGVEGAGVAPPHAHIAANRAGQPADRSGFFADIVRATIAWFAALAACTSTSQPRDAAPDLPDDPGVFDAAHVAFVQLFEWPWPDVARECEEVLGPAGFTAVQISPPNEHAWIETGDGAPFPWWMRYQPVSYRLESRSGTRAELADMVARCKAAGVAIYADVVINHMAAGSGTRSSAGASAWGSKRYPAVPYQLSDFHPPCAVSNYQNASNVQQCELVGLPDLDTGAAYVRGKLVDYLLDLTSLGVAGFRVDAAKHIWAPELAAIVDAVDARAPARPFWFLEVIGSPGEAVRPSQYFTLADHAVTVTEFAAGPRLDDAFRTGTLASLRTFSDGLMPTNHAVPFTDNHDKQRGHAGGGGYLTYHEPQYDLANVFLLAWPYGYPVLMSSYAFERATAYDTSYGPPFDPDTGATVGPGALGCSLDDRHGWICEHRRDPIAHMVGFRKATMARQEVTDWWDNGRNQIAFGRGDLGFVAINHESAPLTRTFHTSLAAGTYCEVIAGGCAPITVDADGNTTLTVPAETAVAIDVAARPIAR